MKKLLSLFTLVFLLGCATSQVEAQSGKTKEAKIKHIQKELKRDDLSLIKRLILMVQLMMLGFGKVDK